ncbi:MAG: ATP phosphoribosyltransferase regulatory subunit, partial [Sphingopyxis sp.]
TEEARDFFAAVTAGLDAAGVAWSRNARLVRGLDYYRHTAFEFVTDRLGAQGTVIGGGRYDGLIEALGGPATPAVGWAAGIERLAMLVGDVRSEPMIAIIPDNPSLDSEARNLAYRLRKEGFQTIIAYRGNAKKHAEVAKRVGAEAALYVRAATSDEYSNVPRFHLTQLKSDTDRRFLNKVLAAIGPDVGGLTGTEPS